MALILFDVKAVNRALCSCLVLLLLLIGLALSLHEIAAEGDHHPDDYVHKDIHLAAIPELEVWAIFPAHIPHGWKPNPFQKAAAWSLAFFSAPTWIKPAQAWFPHGAPTVANPCANGTTWVAYDACTSASASSLYQDVNILTEYVLDINGNPGTLNHAPCADYNCPGIQEPVGPIAPYVYSDPQFSSFTCSNCTTNGTNILTITTITAGTIEPGQLLWQTGFITNHPQLLSCGATTAPTTCTMSVTVPTHSGAMNASTVPGCLWQVTGGSGSASNAGIYCILSAPNTGTAVYDHYEFGAVGGHAATILHVSSNAFGSGVKITSSHFLPDSVFCTAGGNFLSAPISTSAFIDAEYNEFDGGNDGVPPNAPNSSYPCPKQTEGLGWTATGTAGGAGNAAVETLKFNYVHNWAGNGINLQLGYATVLVQSNLFINNGGNNANTGQHGSSIEFGSTQVGGESYSLHVYNNLIAYPFGYTNGVTTCAMCYLAGVGTGLTFDDVDTKLATYLPNISSTAGHAIISPAMIDLFRAGYVVSYKANHNFFNDIGAAGCLAAGGDWQTGGGGTNSISANTGMGTSVLTTSGLVGNPGTIPFQFQTVVNTSGGMASQAVTFTGSLADNGNGTSTLTITGTPPATMLAGQQITAVNLANILSNPTLIVSGASGLYIVSNGSGSGETEASETFNADVHTIQAFGAGGTTATGGTSIAGYNGTWLVNGEQTLSTNPSGWVDFLIGIGNASTLATDVSDNWDIQTAGSAGAILVQAYGHQSFANTQCPNTSPG